MLKKLNRSLIWLLSLVIIPVLMLNTGNRAFAGEPDEGMWLPMFVDRLNYQDMQKMGLHLTPEEIYSVNHSSLKDAIVGLSTSPNPSGFFCTAEVVSDQGLLFTNHHCGYDIIQQHSTLEHDYLTNGFWAMNKSEELQNEALTATFFIRMEDVTDSIIPFLSDTMSESARSAKAKEIATRLKKNANKDDKYNVVVKSFFDGNEYYLFVYQVFKDVRLVGAPPSAIGKFGGDTDNWMWPRQTGDFSIFRVYTGPDGQPADYSKDNVPLKPKYHLPISLDGYKKGDFAMIWGYPGSTDRYLSSYGVDFQLNDFNPGLIECLGDKLNVWKEDMDANREIGIQYASKYAMLANSWKYFIGQTRGLKKMKVDQQKQALEEKFTTWVNADPARKEKYGEVLEHFKTDYEKMGPAFKPLIYTALAGSRGAEIFSLTQKFGQLYGLLESKDKTGAIAETAKELKPAVEEFFKDYNAPTDQKVFAKLLKTYYDKVDKASLPDYFKEMVDKFKGNFNDYAAYVYDKSIFPYKDKLDAFLDNPKFKTIEKDPAYKLGTALTGAMMELGGAYSGVNSDLDKWKRLFMEGLMEMQPNKAFYPDANSTMRFTYGSVEDYKGADAVFYGYVTHLYGVMEKEDPNNPEFIVPAKLKELFKSKDYGQYGENGEMKVCFLTTNDITGGNSGSPVINGNGELIGLAFDGNWEAMSGDIAFEPKVQRTICVDVRYVLFVIDKYAGAKNLIEELTLHKNKTMPALNEEHAEMQEIEQKESE